MSDLINVLKRAAVYTLVYMGIFTVVFWTVFFALVTLQAFWKFFLFVFVVILAMVGYDHLKGTDFADWSFISPSDLRSVLSK